MKKLLLVLAFLLIPQICSANDPMLEKFQEMRFRLEAGLSFRDYNTAYQDLYIAYRKANNEKYKDLMDLYSSFKDVWYEDTQNNGVSDFMLFYNKYPEKSCSTKPNQTTMGIMFCKTIKWSIKLEDKAKGTE